MTELDKFTHEIFTSGGARADHAFPVELHRISLSSIVSQDLLLELADWIRELLQGIVGTCMMAFGAIATFVQFNPLLAALLGILIVVMVQFIVSHITGK